MQITINAAEGGDHSKTIVTKLAKAYSKYLEAKGWLHRIEYAEGAATIHTKDLPEFLNEAGGHRWQEVSPTDKRGRVHTSTVTVGVLLDSDKRQKTPFDLREDEHFTYRTFSGTGSGGQHRNKKQCSVVMTHIPTGLQQKAESRSLGNNLEEAKAKLIMMLDAEKARFGHEHGRAITKQQIGCGMRGDKRRTYRFQDNMVADHETNKSMTCKEFMRGSIDRLWWFDKFIAPSGSISLRLWDRSTTGVFTKWVCM